MPRVIGIDPGTVGIDLCGIDAGNVFLDQSLPTSDALANPGAVLAQLEAAHRTAPLDLIAGPSGYGLPLISGRDLTDRDIRLAQLTADGEDSGGIGGLGSLMRALSRSSLPVMFTPGVVQLTSVPAHRKVNRVDMGTADKVCAVALAVHETAARKRCAAGAVSLILLELGGAFTAVIAVEHGRIVDGAGGTSGPLGMRAAGALDGEVAFLAGLIPKRLLFTGGAASIAGALEATAERLANPGEPRGQVAWDAYLESAIKAVSAMAVAAPLARDIVLSGRVAQIAGVRDEILKRLVAVMPGATVHTLAGFAKVSKHAAQGAALLADGLTGGGSASLVDALGIREARGTVLDHLHVISPRAARARLGISE